MTEKTLERHQENCCCIECEDRRDYWMSEPDQPGWWWLLFPNGTDPHPVHMLTVTGLPSVYTGCHWKMIPIPKLPSREHGCH